MKIEYTKVGADYNGTTKLRDSLLRIIGIIDRATEPTAGQFDAWLPLPNAWEPQLELGMMQGLALESAIKHWRIPRVTHVAVTHAFGPLGLLGIRAHYEAGKQKVEMWFVDDGVSLTPVLSKVYDMEVEAVSA